MPLHERGGASGLTTRNPLALDELQDLGGVQSSSEGLGLAMFPSSHASQPVAQYAFDQFVYHPSFQQFLVDPPPGDFTLCPKEVITNGGLCWVKFNKPIRKESGRVRWQIRLNKIDQPDSMVWLGVTTFGIDLLAQSVRLKNVWVFGNEIAHVDTAIVPHGISLADGDLVTLELDRPAGGGWNSVALHVTVEQQKGLQRHVIGQFKISELPVNADLFPVCYVAARTSYTFVPWERADTHDDVAAATLTESQMQTTLTSALATVAEDAHAVPPLTVADSENGNADQASCAGDGAQNQSSASPTEAV